MIPLPSFITQLPRLGRNMSGAVGDEMNCPSSGRISFQGWGEYPWKEMECGKRGWGREGWEEDEWEELFLWLQFY